MPEDKSTPEEKRADHRLKVHDETMQALQERAQWETKITSLDNQRHTRDRPTRAVRPWHGASNIRYALADLMIDETKPDLCFLPFASEILCVFDTLESNLRDFMAGCERYFDYLVKLPQTQFIKQYFYWVDYRQHYGGAYMKVTWDDNKGVPVYENIHPLLIITPSNAKSLEDCRWFIEVIQLDPDEILEAYSDVDGIEGFVDLVRVSVKRRQDEIEKNKDHDRAGREQNEYERIGISRSDLEGKVVLHIRHFIEDGKRRWETISPDVLDFDFGPSNEYPPGYEDHWMVLRGDREFIEEKINASRGQTEKVAEAEHSLSKAWQAQQNYMALTCNPVFTPLPNQEIPSTTQNFNVYPGSIAPHPLAVLEFPQPPISWTEQKFEILEYGKQRAGRTSGNTGRPLDRQTDETATLTKRKAFVEDKAIQLDGQILSLFLSELFTVTWGLVVANKPESLQYAFSGQVLTLPPEALSNKFNIRIKGSVDQVNKEFRIQRKMMMLEAGMKLPIATPQMLLNIWKSLVHDLEPGSGEEFIPDVSGAGQNEEKAAMVDVWTLLNGGDVKPQMYEDHKIRAEAGMKALMQAEESGQQYTPQQVQAVTNYIAQHKEMLKKTNPQAYEEMMQTLNIIDIQRTRQQMAVELNQRNQEVEARLQDPSPMVDPEMMPEEGMANGTTQGMV